MVTNIGIDLGTSTVLVCLKGKGVVIQEPNVVAIDKGAGTILAIGEEAKQMLGKTPGDISAVKPLQNGVISNCSIMEKVLHHFIVKICGKFRLVRPRVLVCVPSSTTSIERRAVVSVIKRSGAREVYLIEQPVVAAIGIGLPIEEATGNMVVNIGGGTCDIAVISLGGVVQSLSLPAGGDKLEQAILKYIKEFYNLAIGEQTAEEIKIKLGSAYPLAEEETLDVVGRDLISGLPKTITLTSSEIREALIEPITIIVEGIKRVLSKTPAELVSDIMDSGIVLTGGGVKLRGFDLLLQRTLGIPAYVANDSLLCVAKGMERVLEEIKRFGKVF